jgi:glycosyltransferase involved in cell wall biosynthesis
MLRRYGIDVYHTQYISPLYLPAQSLVTIHDILPDTHPDFFTKVQKVKNRIFFRLSTRRAAQIHTVSEYTRAMLIEHYRIDPNRIKVVPNGVDAAQFQVIPHGFARRIIAKQLGIRDYVLSVGRLEPRKNYEGLVHAYKLVKETLPSVGKLVIIGQRDFGYSRIFQTIESLHLRDDVRVLENIDDSLLRMAYRAAAVFAYPSFAEGFGIPPLEAMAAEVPVVASETTAIPEVVGDAARFFDPHRPDEIAEALYAVLSDTAVADDLVSRGKIRAQRWSWRQAATQYIDAIRQMDGLSTTA